MNKIIIPEGCNPEQEEPQVVGLSPEMTRKLTRLQNQIRLLLDHPVPMKSSGPKEPWSDLSDRYDIIIGDFGIKDMTSVPNPEWIDASSMGRPMVMGMDLSSPKGDVTVLPPSSPVEAVSGPDGAKAVEGAFDAWWVKSDSQCNLQGYGHLNKIDCQMAFRAGYEAGRRVK